MYQWLGFISQDKFILSELSINSVAAFAAIAATLVDYLTNPEHPTTINYLST